MLFAGTDKRRAPQHEKWQVECAAADDAHPRQVLSSSQVRSTASHMLLT